MSYKFFCIFFMLLLTICTKIYGDTFRLEGFDEKIDAKILEMNEEYVKVIVPQREISSIKIKSELPDRPTGGDDKYPDAVFLSVNGKESKVVCKIVKITKKPGSITLQIPRERVSAIQIAFPGSEQEDVSSVGRGKREHPPVDAERLKEQIKEELRYEFEKKQKKEDVAIEEKIKEDLRLEFEKKQQIKDETFEAENYGKVRGRMLYKGKPLPRCQVKIMMLEKWGIFGTPKEGIRFETVTDENGRYIFEKVPPGGYKFYWKKPTESYWIRRMKMEPDIFIEAGETYHLPDRETNVKTIN
ncbi:MAG: hypothetical protein SCARUB_02676 [Candidatus Scalindua rubra]|uniref:Cna protein B-type domain protein n=1 Tax=Candidatus Scalindua rubra TaxID=1872076 RepID=A0A1E3X994_9BACT|nr:MAG: hypothetical protein SCARUB_02676 [Candidatus Scalindua rubra]